MAWDFETDPEFQAQLDWVDAFVRDEVEPLDELLGSPYAVKDPRNVRLVRPLQQKVREKGLWACHLTPAQGGQGWGNVRLALLNELLGRSRFGPVVFGTQAPDTGNAEILAHYGTAEQKRKYLQPLLENEIVSCFSMTEPQGGADPLQFRTHAELDGDEWVINGEKWFSSNARWADFLIVLAVTDPDARPHDKMSMFIVPSDTPGIEIVRNVGFHGEAVFDHGYVRYTDVRVPRDHLLGERGKGFAVAQTRLGGGRIHHAMRTIGEARKALDLMCRRALSRHTAGSLLADKQMVQEKIADSWIELEQFRLLVLRTAWLIDKHQDYKKVRRDIAAVKVAMPKVLNDIATRAIQIHGALGISTEMPFILQITTSFVMGIADGPTEVHKVTVAKQVLREHEPYDTLFPPYSLLTLREQAEEKYGALLADLREDELEGV
ncbi:acyl-CoA dehydrogenase family protein [Flavisphingomonas formosensis]|uniref:acyl-CoA dehydrogenase family protein n=1 Tax=Flavisphingomonas formosensis TaxID=861534 RepID=UPI0012F740D8|nr:acyl-CoA dehydrogenase family protein [Sphingomonas formosensis]